MATQKVPEQVSRYFIHQNCKENDQEMLEMAYPNIINITVRIGIPITAIDINDKELTKNPRFSRKTLRKQRNNLYIR